MKVIFLDVDGNLNDVYTKTKHLCEGQWYDGVDKEKIFLLKNIIDATGAKIVISSTWRKYKDSMNYLLGEMGKEFASHIVGQTPVLEGQPRANEVDAWLSEHPEVTKFIVIDDNDSENLEKFGGSFVLTKMSYGLTEEIAKQCIDLLQ